MGCSRNDWLSELAAARAAFAAGPVDDALIARRVDAEWAALAAAPTVSTSEEAAEVLRAARFPAANLSNHAGTARDLLDIPPEAIAAEWVVIDMVEAQLRAGAIRPKAAAAALHAARIAGFGRAYAAAAGEEVDADPRDLTAAWEAISAAAARLTVTAIANHAPATAPT